jgi:hypothetical protein
MSKLRDTPGVFDVVCASFSRVVKNGRDCIQGVRVVTKITSGVLSQKGLNFLR